MKTFRKRYLTAIKLKIFTLNSRLSLSFKSLPAVNREKSKVYTFSTLKALLICTKFSCKYKILSDKIIKLFYFVPYSLKVMIMKF